jgi:pSer/pThr/pTyr-binding forkhead associated (FHA) protein
MSGIVAFFLRILLSISLYAFLGWGLYTIWNQIRSNSLILKKRQIPSITLTSLEDEVGLHREFSQPEIFVGRDTNCDLPIVDETVSAHHAHLNYHHNQWWVEDLRSKNGTFLNGERVETPTVIITGDELRCGQIDFSITIKN